MIKLAIDMGTSITKIYRADTNSGIVLAEPSCVAVSADGEIKAIGKEAKNLMGKTAEYTSITYPAYEGEIVDMRLCVEMLKTFLGRVGFKPSSFRRSQVLFSVPCGISSRSFARYKDLAEECGLKKVFFVEQPYLSAIGAGVSLMDSDPVFCLDIGGGVSNAAVLSSDGIIAGISMNIGGNNMDANIVSRIAKNNNLHIGALTAEKLKNEIGSLASTALGTMVAEGSSVETCQPASTSVQASDITECIRVYVDKILEYVAAVLWKLPAEVAATVNRNGVFLSGGVMKIPYLPQYIGRALKMQVRVCEEPQFATALGGGTLFTDKQFLYKFSKKMDD